MQAKIRFNADFSALEVVMPDGVEYGPLGVEDQILLDAADRPFGALVLIQKGGGIEATLYQLGPVIPSAIELNAEFTSADEDEDGDEGEDEDEDDQEEATV